MSLSPNEPTKHKVNFEMVLTYPCAVLYIAADGIRVGCGKICHVAWRCFAEIAKWSGYRIYHSCLEGIDYIGSAAHQSGLLLLELFHLLESIGKPLFKLIPPTYDALASHLKGGSLETAKGINSLWSSIDLDFIKEPLCETCKALLSSTQAGALEIYNAISKLTFEIETTSLCVRDLICLSTLALLAHLISGARETHKFLKLLQEPLKVGVEEIEEFVKETVPQLASALRGGARETYKGSSLLIEEALPSLTHLSLFLAALLKELVTYVRPGTNEGGKLIHFLIQEEEHLRKNSVLVDIWWIPKKIKIYNTLITLRLHLRTQRQKLYQWWLPKKIKILQTIHTLQLKAKARRERLYQLVERIRLRAALLVQGGRHAEQ
jgi:hypothetical protein